LDHALSDGDSSTIYERMTERNIPFVTYIGYDHLGETGRGVYVKKPAPMSELVATVQCVIAERQASNRQLSVNRQLSILEGDAVANTPQRTALHLS
jgi:hypothetical protein